MALNKFKNNNKYYSIHRAGIALDRLNVATTLVAKRQAAQWAMAWFVAGGMRPPVKFRLKSKVELAVLPQKSLCADEELVAGTTTTVVGQNDQ